MTNLATLALGSNLSFEELTPATVIGSTCHALEALGDVTARSALYQTPAFPAGSGPDYANAVVQLRTALSPLALLEALHKIEADAGRERLVRWGARTLDIDLLSYEDQILPDRATWQDWHDLPLEAQINRTPSELILPHPRLHERAFVLVPLAEIAPDWRHPVLGHSARALCDALPSDDRRAVTLWPAP